MGTEGKFRMEVLPSDRAGLAEPGGNRCHREVRCFSTVKGWGVHVLLDSSGPRIPDELVELDLKPDGQVFLQ